MKKILLNESKKRLLDKYRGCLIGGAVGDALGYAVEFSDEESIRMRYGEGGITEYMLEGGVAEISDDTQMTLFTANGLLLCETGGKLRGIGGSYSSYIGYCYRDWYKTQSGKYPLGTPSPYTWLVNVPELFSRRAPGNSCLSALSPINGIEMGTIDNPINMSKGCGGVMRVAPIGLYFKGEELSINKIDMIGAEAAAITHGHELGYIPAAALVHIIHLVSHSAYISLRDAVLDMIGAMKRLFPKAKHMKEFVTLMKKALLLSEKKISDIEAIHMLGEGWVAEETLAIAIYCALKYSDDFEKAIVASVNHKGDSDSTGAVTANILGAYLGIGSIPDKYLEALELKDVIIELADDLYTGCVCDENGELADEKWERKYVLMTYKPE